MIHNATPVLTYNMGGSIESVTKETGFIVEQGDFNGVLIAIEEMCLKGESYYTPLCRQRAEQYFN